jgi:Vacuolar protein sorting-associated protein 62
VYLQLTSIGAGSLTVPSAPPIFHTPWLYSYLPLPTTALTGGNPSSVFTTVPAPAETESPKDWTEIPVVDPPHTAGSVIIGYAEVENLDSEMKNVKTKAAIGLLSTLISYVSLNSILKTTHPDLFVWRPEDLENSEWTATSKSWLDRKACRWLGICGGSHLHLVRNHFGRRPSSKGRQQPLEPSPEWDWQHAWNDGRNSSDDWSEDERLLREIPDYVMEYAPLVHLYSGEQFWPCDIAEHLYHITPSLNYTPIQSERHHLSLKHLNKLNEFQSGRWVYLTSNDNVEERPEWLEGEKNIPIDPSVINDTFDGNDGWIHHPGRSFLQSWIDGIGDMSEWYAPGLANLEEQPDFRKSQYPTFSTLRKEGSFRGRYHDELKKRRMSISPEHRLRGGRSDAPAVLVAVDKGHGIVDAFWFFFYSFNLGNVVFNVRFGNHVGDWEHTMIRFDHGKPKAVFFSEHNFGSAYSYEAVEKIGRRPVIYSAVGTHAMYATPGGHPYVLPWGILHDQTDRGPLWDPALNSHAFTYDVNNQTLRASNLTPEAPTGWFHFGGRWGDKFYALGDKRQYRFLGQYHYVSGPFGPKFKHLGRKKICQGPDSSPCVIKHWIGGTDNVRFSTGLDEDDKDDIET